ncbi:DUF2252 domain-containing protein [Salipiger mucosus]|uniref:DUF2252 domain-containing protein n=1 Tax=Salipiger mucosus DSM 16094 TaxID=1123237 RepID=S9RNQ7_9RHOB|nr:DUF2252 family protein [Salipiger mucosus]EPX79715.1 hypothetical protein Salmuc_05658 [Salipiger mucosus DSM 16094]
MAQTESNSQSKSKTGGQRAGNARSQTRKTSEKAQRKAGPAGGNGPSPVQPVTSLVEDYKGIARAFAENPVVMRPCNLDGHARRLHVRATIIEDHAVRIDQQSQGAEEKFKKLSESLFKFFRGTSLLFHRDMAGDDERMPTVLVLGDVHPENFGVMPNADNVPIFGVNDFDDVLYGPFTWDLKRGVTGFMIASEEVGGHKKKTRRKIASRFVKGYRAGMEYYSRHNTEATEQMREDNSPKIIRKLFDEAEESRKEWLWDRYLDETGRGFRANEELTPISSRLDEFQAYVDKLAGQNEIARDGRAGKLRVKDVAMRHGQGTASLGLPRYYCLIEGPAGDATDDLILEFKRARRSALDGLVPKHDFDAGQEGDRIAHGQSVHLAKGDVFYGSVEIDGESFMSRERAPFREDIDLDELSKKSWKHYAEACGHALAQAHARSDDAGQLDYRIEPRILEAMEPFGLFVDDMLCFAEEAVERMRRDHAFYKRDLEMGAFDMTLKRYR